MNKYEIPKFLKFPFQFDAERLVDDLNSISEHDWSPQIYKMNYSGKWTSLALISPNGKNDTFSTSNARQGTRPTAILEKSPYFKEVFATFQSPFITARLLRLNAHSEIKPHRDFKLGYEDNNFRLHIPIITNAQVEFVMEGEQIVMQAGECWYTNVNYTHSVANRSDQDRIHLVIDCERNEWSDHIFFSLAPKESFNLDETKTSIETLQRTLEELEHQNDPKLAGLMLQLKEDIKQQLSSMHKLKH
ncbi:MAG: aspartyl/asparaginyl beta-hydroxylase domain-containing protein [Saprospiraceae bacterium]|nr:aspartyl/asparaginyl beta-hydroxylase domain-containing protein [Saprospiraceae bacterium]